MLGNRYPERPHWTMIRHLRSSSLMRGAASAYAMQRGLGFTLKSPWWPSTCAQQAHHPRCAYEFPRGHPHAVCIKTQTMQRSIRAERHCTLIDNQHHANAIASLVCLNDSRFSHMAGRSASSCCPSSGEVKTQCELLQARQAHVVPTL